MSGAETAEHCACCGCQEAESLFCGDCGEYLLGYNDKDEECFAIMLGVWVRRFVRRAEVADLVDRILIDADRLRERDTDDWGPIQERLARLAELALEDR